MKSQLPEYTLRVMSFGRVSMSILRGFLDLIHYKDLDQGSCWL